MVAASTSIDHTPTLDNLIDELYGSSAQESARQEWAAAVQTVATQAKDALPDSHSRIEKAAQIVLADGLELLDGGGKAKITSQSTEGTQYHIANGTCDCADFSRAPSGWCKHVLLVHNKLYRNS